MGGGGVGERNEKNLRTSIRNFKNFWFMNNYRSFNLKHDCLTENNTVVLIWLEALLLFCLLLKTGNKRVSIIGHQMIYIWCGTHAPEKILIKSQLSFQDYSFSKVVRPSLDHGPESKSDQCPDLNQTKIRVRSKRSWPDLVAVEPFMVRPSCACSHLWSDWSTLETGSDQTQVRSK